jgi:hypothetical protein
MPKPIPSRQAQERNELNSVLNSGIFAKASQQARLLQYVCDEYFEGRADQIKEYRLATEVLGRAPDFDQDRDAIVRVEFHRLRKKLNEYYQGEGAQHPFHIIIDSGHYVPRFVPREGTLGIQHRAPTEAAPVQETQELEAPVPVPPAAPMFPSRRGLRSLGIVLGGLATLAVLVIAISKWRKPLESWVNAQPSLPSASSQGTGSTPVTLDSVRILCGYYKDKHIDNSGNVWLGDRYFSGGDAVTQSPQFIARAPDMTLYQTFRSGTFSYNIPLKSGNYEMHLYFVETQYGPGTLSGGGETTRLFNVDMNGKRLLNIFDIIKDAGGNNIADVRVFKDVRPAVDGYLRLRFEALNNPAILNAVEIVPVPPGKIRPIRIVAQNNSYTDHAGDVWSPDCYYSGGQLALHIAHPAVSGTQDPNLYSSERFGNFSYAIPVAPGRYKVTLHFAETYWGSQNQQHNLPDQNASPVGGAGSRIFDVYCNGVALIRNFDIFKEAGGSLQALDKTFHNLEPNAEGKLLLTFLPVRDYACLNALEVENEPD